MSERCGAKTRDGGTCKARKMPNGRCRMHGGKTPATNQNAKKHGFYSSILDDSEKLIFGQATLEDALNMAYIQHMRALKNNREDLAEKMLGRIAQLEKARAEIQADEEEEAFDEIEMVEYEEGDI